MTDGVLKLNRLLRKVTKLVEPPEDLTVSQWAEKYRRLSPESSNETGAYRVSRTPYMREILDCFADPIIRRIILVSSSQVGKSELENNIIGYIIHQDPSSILFIHPTTIDAKEYSKLRIAPMIRDSPALRKRVASPKSRDSGNTILQKSYPGGILTLCGSTEAHALASKPIRYVIGDERDRWAVSAGTEGDPWKLAMARQITFYNAKAVEVSTPTIKEASPIADSFLEGTMERWCVQCPHCGKYHDIRFKNIEETHREFEVNGRLQFEIQSVLYRCPDCQGTADQKTMLHQPAKWVAENPDAYKRGVRSFWLNSFASPWAAWEDTMLEYLYAVGSSTKLQVVYNTRLGELWSLADSNISEAELLARREEYSAELPDGVLALTCGVDTQDDRFEYEVIGHGRAGETWGILRGVIHGRPDDTKTWEQLDAEVFDRVFYFKDGLGLKISKAFVDEGGHYTQYIRQNCQARQRKHVFACKGFAGEDRSYTAPPRDMKIVINHEMVGTCKQYQLGVDSGKLMIMDNLKVTTVGPRYCHFPRRDDYGPAYFRGLVSETQVAVTTKSQAPGHKFKWVQIPGHERNEPLDCRNYALAAFEASNINLDAIEHKLRTARGQEEVPKKPVQDRPAVKQRPVTRTRSGIEQYFSQW